MKNILFWADYPVLYLTILSAPMADWKSHLAHGEVRTLVVRYDARILNATTIHHQDLAQSRNQDVMHFPMKPHLRQLAENSQSDL